MAASVRSLSRNDNNNTTTTTTTHEYVHCSYEKDGSVCDQANSQQPPPQPPPTHLHHHEPPPQPQETSHCQRKHSHSHSPHHSRHTSPHSHSHSHSHHHHYRRKRRPGSGSLPGAHTQPKHSHSMMSRHPACSSRRHRSVTDVSTQSISNCQDPLCLEREIRKANCCTSSVFAEELYGSSSRRPSSCCTSSDYCYQTDSTSLYGSRSSLSRNNSIKSASAAMRKQQRLQNRQPSYTSISLRGLNQSQMGSLTSIFDRNKPQEDSTLERQSSKGALSNDLPEYACSPSPIRWSFLAGGKSPTELEGAVGGVDPLEVDKMDAWHMPEVEKKPCRKIKITEKSSTSFDDDAPSTSAAARKRGFHCEFEEESTTVLYHQDTGESFNNCCSNYIQCNSYLDQDLQITSEDIQQYLSKGQPTGNLEDVLNNSKNYPFQPSNALEFQYKNNFQQGGNNNNHTNTTNTASSDAAECFQNYRSQSKETNLNQTETNINLSTSSNNINIVFNSSLERNANEVKFINNREGEHLVVSCEGHHSGYLAYSYPSYDYSNMSGNSHFDKPLDKEYVGVNSTASEHSSSLPSPQSEHSLMSPVNPSGDDLTHLHHHPHHHTHHLHPPHMHHMPHFAHLHQDDQFRLGNAFKRVRKRARKYTDFLRKK